MTKNGCPMSAQKNTKSSIQSFHVDSIGTVVFVKNPKARRISISVRPFEDVRITVPRACSVEKAKIFLEGSIGWIREQQRTAGEMEVRSRTAVDSLGGLGKKEAENILAARFDELASHFGFLYRRIVFRHQKTRWGSCSSKNVINLNRSLIILPDELKDYVFLHELTHTIHKHHGPAFWQALESCVGDSRRLRKELRRYAIPPDNFLRP